MVCIVQLLMQFVSLTSCVLDSKYFAFPKYFRTNLSLDPCSRSCMITLETA